MADEPISELEMIENAWKRIGATHDGRVARRRLEEVLTMVLGFRGRHGALRHSEGRRSLAHELILLMDAEVPGATRYSPKPIKRDGAVAVERRAGRRLGGGPGSDKR